MPANTTDQQITYPVGTDPANNPVAFTDMLADVETRLVLKYATEADRAARHTAPQEGDLTGLADVGRYEVYDSPNYISAFTYSLYGHAVRSADIPAIVSNTTLANDSVLTLPLPTTGRFEWEAVIFYDSSTTADFKLAFTWPAAVSTPRWGIQGLATGATLTTGDGQFAVTATSGTAIAVGGAGSGSGSTLMAIAKGHLVLGGTAGNLTVQYAQNTSDATNTVVRSGSRLHLWKVGV